MNAVRGASSPWRRFRRPHGLLLWILVFASYAVIVQVAQGQWIQAATATFVIIFCLVAAQFDDSTGSRDAGNSRK